MRFSYYSLPLSSQEWSDILKLYEKNNAFLGTSVSYCFLLEKHWLCLVICDLLYWDCPSCDIVNDGLCRCHVTSCDFSSSWVCPAVDEERQLWDTSLEAADCKVPSNTAGMIHCAPTSPDVIHKMNTSKPFISLFYFHVLFQRKGQGVINGGGLWTHYNYPISVPP